MEINIIKSKTKQAIFELLYSHSKLSKAEYNRNHSYNNQHFSYKAEEKIMDLLYELNLMDEYIAYHEAKEIMEKYNGRMGKI